MPTGKIPIIHVVLSFVFILFSAPECFSGQIDLQPSAEGTAAIDSNIFVFDGRKLSEIRDTDNVISMKSPATEGNYFAVFFTKAGRVPVIRTIKAEGEYAKIGREFPDKTISHGKGFLAGVVYKPVYGGKLSGTRGMVKLIKDAEIAVIGQGKEDFAVMSGESGSYGIELPAGKYRVRTGGGKWLNVTIKNGLTTIQNLQRGLTLRD